MSTTNGDDKPSFFSRYIDAPKERPAEPETIPRGPLLKPIVPPTDHRSPPIEKTLDWLVNRWPKPTVRVRDILRFGPNPIRNRTSAIATAEILAQRGWLSPSQRADTTQKCGKSFGGQTNKSRRLAECRNCRSHFLKQRAFTEKPGS